MRQRHGWWALAAMLAGSVLLLLAGYVGAYAFLVRPHNVTWEDRYEIRNYALAVYPPRWERWNWLFRPVHKLDRALRPRMWYDMGIPKPP